MKFFKDSVLVLFMVCIVLSMSSCSLNKINKHIVRDRNMPVKQLDCIYKFIKLDIEKLKTLDTNLLDIRTTCINVYKAY